MVACAGEPGVIDAAWVRDDTVLMCYHGDWLFWAGVAGIGILVYCIGLPILAAVLSRKYHRSNQESLEEREKVILLVGSYESK